MRASLLAVFSGSGLPDTDGSSGISVLSDRCWVPVLGESLEKILENNAMSTAWIRNGLQHNKKAGDLCSLSLSVLCQ